MSSRTTDDYEAMAASGVVAVIEPAFLKGNREIRRNFYRLLCALMAERFRASQFGIRHYCTMA